LLRFLRRGKMLRGREGTGQAEVGRTYAGGYGDSDNNEGQNAKDHEKIVILEHSGSMDGYKTMLMPIDKHTILGALMYYTLHECRRDVMVNLHFLHRAGRGLYRSAPAGQRRHQDQTSQCRSQLLNSGREPDQSYFFVGTK
jgi:hypothetical protein